MKKVLISLLLPFAFSLASCKQAGETNNNNHDINDVDSDPNAPKQLSDEQVAVLLKDVPAPTLHKANLSISLKTYVKNKETGEFTLSKEETESGPIDVDFTGSNSMYSLKTVFNNPDNIEEIKHIDHSFIKNGDNITLRLNEAFIDEIFGEGVSKYFPDLYYTYNKDFYLVEALEINGCGGGDQLHIEPHTEPEPNDKAKAHRYTKPVTGMEAKYSTLNWLE